MITPRFLLFLVANLLGLIGYAGSTWAATEKLGDTGWYAEFDGAKVMFAPTNTAGVFTVTKTFNNLQPIDIKFIETFPAGKDDFGLRITLNEAVQNRSGADWKSFGLELIDPNPVLVRGDPNGVILGKNDNVAANHPGFAHFHKDTGQAFPPFTPDPNPQGAGAPQQGKIINLTGGTFSNNTTETWKGLGIHQIEEAAQQRNFILRETPFVVAPPPPFGVPPIPEPETYAMLLAGLGLMSVVVRRRSSLKISISRESAV